VTPWQPGKNTQKFYEHLEAVNKLAQEGIDLDLDDGCNEILAIPRKILKISAR
jgi:hypothetical protein